MVYTFFYRMTEVKGLRGRSQNYYQHLWKRTESTLGGGGLGSPYVFPPKIKKKCNHWQRIIKYGTRLESGPTPFSLLYRLLFTTSLSTLFRYIINTYSMHTFVALSCRITHSKNFHYRQNVRKSTFFWVAPHRGFCMAAQRSYRLRWF